MGSELEQEESEESEGVCYVGPATLNRLTASTLAERRIQQKVTKATKGHSYGECSAMTRIALWTARVMAEHSP